MGDKSAFGQLVERFQEEAYGLAYYHLGHREDALDVAQQAFLAAYLHLDSLTDPARFGGWLARIVANECLRWHRRRRPTLSLDTPALGDLQDDQAMSPERAAEQGNLRRDLNRALMALPRSQRLALTLYYVAGLRYRKIAEVVELPITTVKGRIQVGRKRLRRILGPTYERRLTPRQPATAKRQSRVAIKENVMAQLEELAIRYKVRDVYDLGDQLLIVVSDRISAFDVVLPTAIPGKGKVLNQLSAYWFEQTQDLLPNHVLTTDVDDYPAELQAHAAQLTGRSMLVRRAERVDIECVARGYITGSGWAEYQKSGTVCGIRLPAGLIEAQQLPEPIFTPTTKAETGHDEPLTFEEVEAMVGRPLAAQLRDATLAIYAAAAEQARERGIIIADTKMEFGIVKGQRERRGPVDLD